MPDTHDERGGDEVAVRIAAMLRAYREDDDDEAVEIVHSDLYLTIGDLRRLVRDREQLAAATARAEKAERQFDLARSLNRLAKANAVELHAQLDAARARFAEFGEPEVEQRIIGVSGLVYTPTKLDLEHRAEWLSGVRLEERQVYPTPWRVVYPVCRSCGTVERVAGDPPLCSNCAVYGAGWSSQRPDASLDGLRGPFTGLIGPLGLTADASQDGRSEPVERSKVSGGSFQANTSATASAGLSELCPCGCPKIGDGCNCRYCNEPYPTRQPNDDTTGDDR